MTTFGYFLSCEEHGPKELVRQARAAERAGFEALWISDHFHPWLDEQGQAPFVWSVIGALAEATSLPITTAVTCPLVRTHPAVVAQAAATTAALSDGRFRLGVGTGEALNEHVVDPRWPPVSERLEMLEEAVGVIRELFTGKLVTHRGRHYTVDTARLYTLPREPAPIYMSGFGRKSIDLAARIADGYVTTMPDADAVSAFRAAGGAGKPVLGGLKACYAADEQSARKTVHRLWPTQGIKGEASQLLPLPRHFEQLAQMVSEDEAVNGSPVGPDPEVHAQAIRQYVDAGFDEVYVNQIGEEQDAFFTFYEREVLPRVR
ncbi:TIGR03557 family F420-dependent LLM class oxidoreductase [Nonomuraea phyllanthi]|uniref:TIGR03557 family F420-dependent LLM class oxidoreductase n=1 Tax=Nonomuraea phyllanthi TaxID=2219224 RepID=A0A5C4WET8_9ACTN|nr:TIGR03557 family F420-dependent LLM class oxidoreductase [Nonomuraea phyllanthi]KAB8193530.1 TIGR03557 family F420-dependent LLM class oxidoreductase [Nonomuraea phyllanthi]QFY12272.1 TIGR03557 family F420-dependent LLM class oxidoreductase [Nonomuraea phyllanthi]